MASAKVWAAVIIVIIIIIGAAAYLATRGKGPTTTTTGTASPTTTAPATTSTPTKTTTTTAAGGATTGLTYVKIGALLPLTGDLASFGKANKAAVLLAAKDFNAYLAKKGANWRIKIIVVDTMTDPETARERFDALYSQGIRFFIGPMSSAELSKIVSLVHQGYKAVVISQSSTAPSLALKDTVFRFPPPDEFQGKVLATLYKHDGVKYVIIIYRNDDWGRGLSGYVKEYFTKAGGKVYDMIPYDPKAANFDNIVEQARDDVQALLKKGVKPSEIGIELIAFEEAAKILETASSYKVLAEVHWYGSDGTAFSQAVLQSSVAASFAAKVHWKNTITFSITNKTSKVFCTLKKEIGYTPDPYSLIAYDAVWVMGLAIEKAGGPKATVDAVAKAIPEVLKTYEGVTGKIVLNQYGDRAGSDYGIFEIVKTPSGYQWQITELYKFETGQIVEVKGNPLSCK
ncbi:MAG: penicillin-binding protein activator [Desulfurococcales archaeon]|nr:penicillin-binding protein activator [Desulfurococcales archaeon]